MSMLAPFVAIAAATAQDAGLPVEMSHRAADQFEQILYKAMRDVRRGMPEPCHKVRTYFSLADEELEKISFTCLEKDGEKLDVAIDPAAMPIDQFQRRYLRLRDAIDERLKGEPIAVTMTVDRRGRIRSQFLFFDFYR